MATATTSAPTGRTLLLMVRLSERFVTLPGRARNDLATQGLPATQFLAAFGPESHGADMPKRWSDMAEVTFATVVYAL